MHDKDEILPTIGFVKADGVVFALFDNKDLISNEIREKGSFAKKEAMMARQAAIHNKGAIILDIGANLGAFTVPMAPLLLSNQNKVLCFEPQKIIFYQLCTNIFINRLSNVDAFNLAVGDKDCVIEVPRLNFIESTNSGGFSVDTSVREKLELSAKNGRTAINKSSADTEKVSMKSIDSMGIKEPICFMKIDVEGNELECLIGAKETIKKNNYPPFVYEDWGAKFDWYITKSQLLRQFIEKELGYRTYSLGNREYLAQHPKHKFQFEITLK